MEQPNTCVSNEIHDGLTMCKVSWSSSEILGIILVAFDCWVTCVVVHAYCQYLVLPCMHGSAMAPTCTLLKLLCYIDRKNCQ